MSLQLLPSTKPEYRIRRYAPRDRQAVWRLAADTAFFGSAVEAFLDDRALFCDAFVAYYTEYEAEWLWVAEEAGQLTGYVTGCADSGRRDRIWRIRFLPRLVYNMLRGRYRVGRKTLSVAGRAARAWARREVPRVSAADLPAHLHINVAAAARGRGVGRALLRACLDTFWQAGIRGVHLHTTDYNRAACRLYESTGFRLLSARPTALWRGLVPVAVESRAYGLLPAWYDDRQTQ